jgi:hypothetical protein
MEKHTIFAVGLEMSNPGKLIFSLIREINVNFNTACFWTVCFVFLCLCAISCQKVFQNFYKILSKIFNKSNTRLWARKWFSCHYSYFQADGLFLLWRSIIIRSHKENDHTHITVKSMKSWVLSLLQKDVTQFNGKKLSQMEPHVFAISEAAFQSLHNSQQNQSCIISGESGAGKVMHSYLPCVGAGKVTQSSVPFVGV